MMKNENIPVVILAGGNGTMLGGNPRRSKTMVKIDGQPLLDYIISYFSRSGFKHFIVAAGLGADLIEEYVNGPETLQQWAESGLTVDIVHTGIKENTGARLAKLKSRLQDSPCFVLTYGDVIADVPLDKLVQFHDTQKRLVTVTAAHAPTRFRILGLQDVSVDVQGFANNPILQRDYISGGYYVLSNKIFDLPVLSDNPSCSFEFDVLQELVLQKQIVAYRHDGYWQSLDTERDMEKLIQYFKKS